MMMALHTHTATPTKVTFVNVHIPYLSKANSKSVFKNKNSSTKWLVLTFYDRTEN